MSTKFISEQFDALEGAAHREPRFKLSYQAIAFIAGLSEVLISVGSSCFSHSFYHWYWGSEDQVGAAGAIGIGVLAAITYISFARMAELYRLPAILKPQRYLAKVFGLWATSFLMLVMVLFLLKTSQELSRGYFLFFGFLTLALLVCGRLISSTVFVAMIYRGAIAGRSAIVVGDRTQLAQLTSTRLLHYFGFREIARIALPDESALGEDQEKRSALLSKALFMSRAEGAEEFVLAVGWEKTTLLGDIKGVLRNSPLPVRLLPDLVIRSTLGRAYPDRMIGLSATVELQRAPMTLVERIIKRCLDVVCASLAIFMLAPVFLFAALAIKLDSNGPTIFRQRRNGFNERQFTIYKFRTMRVQEDGAKVLQAQREDPRVTRVGKLLRRTSIDELPQLFNVLKGDMSLIGPRPHAMAHDDQYKKLIETYCCRHHVKPGLTGWAQVHGLRGETRHLVDMRQRVEYDLWYINNWSLKLDLQILARTCFEVLKHDAY